MREFFYQQKKLQRREALLHGGELPRADFAAHLRFGIYGVDDALMIAGLAASVAGTGMGIAGNAEAQSAMNAARSSEVQKEKEFQQQGNQVFNKSLSTSGADAAKNTAAAGAAQRQNAFTALSQVAQPIAGAPLPSDQNPNPIVNGNDPTEQANSLAKTRGNAFTTLTSNAQSQEGGLQDWQARQSVNDAEANRQLSVIGDKARGSAALLPLEMQVAGTKGDALSGWGQLFSALGSVAGTAGAVGAGAGSPSFVDTQRTNILTRQAPGGGWLFGNVEPGDL